MRRVYSQIETGFERTDTASNVQLCDHAGCRGEGLYRAPKARDRLNEYFWFCLDHVRDYNRAWNFYAGMNPEQIERQLRIDTVWDRPTWPLGRWGVHKRIFGSDFIPEDIDPFGERRPPAPPAPKSKTDLALAELDLAPGSSVEQIKKRYKTLAKALHPDANGGDKAAEERLKVINLAYSTLKSSVLV